jgi:hypothetical protein
MVLLSVSKQQKTIQRKLEWIVLYFGNISILCRHNLIYNLSVLSKRKGLNAMTNLQFKKQYQLQNQSQKNNAGKNYGIFN